MSLCEHHVCRRSRDIEQVTCSYGGEYYMQVEKTCDNEPLVIQKTSLSNASRFFFGNYFPPSFRTRSMQQCFENFSFVNKPHLKKYCITTYCRRCAFDDSSYSKFKPFLLHCFIFFFCFNRKSIKKVCLKVFNFSALNIVEFFIFDLVV